MIEPHPPQGSTVVPFGKLMARPPRNYRELEIWCHGDPLLVPKFGWLFKQLIPRVGVGILAGPSQHYKSYLELDTCLSIILGLSHAGVELEPDMQGATLVFCAEKNNPIEQRLGAVVQAKAVPYFNGNVPVLPFFSTRRVPLLTDKNAYDDISEIIESVNREIEQRGFACVLRYISYDTMAKSTLFKDASSGAENQPVMNLMERISSERQLFFNAVDHLGKDQSKGIINSIVKYNSADVVRYVIGDKTGNEKPTNLRMIADKMRAGRGSGEMPFEMVPIVLNGTWADDQGNGISELTVKWGNGADTPKTRWPRTRSQKLLAQCLTEALLAHGYLTTPVSGMTPVAAVDDKFVRQLFHQKHPPTTNPESRRKTINTNYRRAATESVNVAAIGVHEVDTSTVLMWKITGGTGDNAATMEQVTSASQ
jgi:hypothetical protein